MLEVSQSLLKYIREIAAFCYNIIGPFIDFTGIIIHCVVTITTILKIAARLQQHFIV